MAIYYILILGQFIYIVIWNQSKVEVAILEHSQSPYGDHWEMVNLFSE